MEIAPFGDSALLINFEQKIDEKINARVVNISDSITSAEIDGVLFCVPAYCSITVGYNPLQIQYETLVEKANAIIAQLSNEVNPLPARIVNIPVCYDHEYALDKAEVIKQTNLTWQDVIESHTSQEYRVYMLGFIAGFAYMGTLRENLKCTRKANPVMNIPSGTVAIAGMQTGIYPTKAHAGWQLIGRTPVTVFSPSAINPFLFKAGDIVRFKAIDRNEYLTISSALKAGTFNFNSVLEHE